MSSKVERVLAERYELRTPLGKGGMGKVWRAYDRILKREVAVKEVNLPPSLGSKEADALRARVMREARAAARLSHPGAVTIYDVVEEDERPWIVMQLVNGPTLDEAVKDNGPLSSRDAARLGLQMLEVLEVAHREGIVHRDIKPGNVMLPPGGDAKLADFGIATLQGDPKITATGLILGSPSFMPPEQAQHGRGGPGGDIWSLGATLYFAVEGKPPFDKGQAIPTLTAVVGEDVPPPRRAGALGDVLLDMLQKDPDARPDPESLRSRLALLASDAATAAAPPSETLKDGTTELLDEPPEPRKPETRVGTSKQGPAAHPEPVVVRSEPASRRPTARRSDSRWLWALAGIGAAILAAVVLSAVLGGEETDAPRARADGQRQNGGETNSEDSGSEDPEGENVPDGWTVYEDPTFGYRVAHPEGWTTRDASGAVDLVSPDAAGTYLRVGATDEPGDDVMARLEDIADDFSASHEDYQEIRLSETDYRAYESGIWEYSYTEGDLALHAYNLQFVTGDFGFALNFQTTEELWAESQDEWEAFLSSFVAP